MRNPRFDFEVPTLAEFLNNPQEELDSKASEISSVEDTQIQSVEEPLAETLQQNQQQFRISKQKLII